jgi:sarcosine oxidase subunit alpha
MKPSTTQRDLRIDDGVERGEPFYFEMDGAPIRAYPGETIAGAVLATGRYLLRRTGKLGSPRGVFCGIGLCYECRIVVNGEPNVRACMTRAEPGDHVETQNEFAGVGREE